MRAFQQGEAVRYSYITILIHQHELTLHASDVAQYYSSALTLAISFPISFPFACDRVWTCSSNSIMICW